MSAAYDLRATVRAEVAARVVENDALATLRRGLLTETRAAEARAEWDNLCTMGRAGGRPVPVRTVRDLGRAAGVDAAEVARVAAEIGAVL